MRHAIMVMASTQVNDVLLTLTIVNLLIKMTQRLVSLVTVDTPSRITSALELSTNVSNMTLPLSNALYATAVMDLVPVVFYASTQFNTVFNIPTVTVTAMNVPKIQ